VRIAISSPPVPDVTPDDRTLTLGELVGAIVEISNEGNRTASRLRSCPRVSAKLRRSGAACRKVARLRPGQSVAYRVLARAKRNACRGRLSYTLTVRGAGQRAKVRRALGRLLAGACGNRPCPTITRVRARPGPTARRGAPRPAARAGSVLGLDRHPAERRRALRARRRVRQRRERRRHVGPLVAGRPRHERLDARVIERTPGHHYRGVATVARNLTRDRPSKSRSASASDRSIAGADGVA
jgi:hypothetical protein